MKASESIFSKDVAFEGEEILIEGREIENPAAVINVCDVDQLCFEKGDEFAREIEEKFISDFENTSCDKMVHVSTFALIDGVIYMTYYANKECAEENPRNQTARIVYCPRDKVDEKTFVDVMTVGDTLCGERVNMVYDTIFARVNYNTMMILWTAKVGENYYRLYRSFDITSKTLGEIGVNRLKVGNVVNDFSSTGIVSALACNGLGHKKMYSDIGIMQKFTERVENGVTYYYSGAYSGDLNMIIKSTDFITWEYVSEPDFINLSKWENAVYVLDNKCYYFVRQQDTTKYGFLTAYDLEKGTWEKPVLVEDCQSRSDFIVYNGDLYLFHAPTDREHIGIIKICKENLAQSRVVLQAKMHSSCFYPFIQYFEGGELAMSYTVARRHIRLAKFTLSKYI